MDNDRESQPSKPSRCPGFALERLELKRCPNLRTPAFGSFAPPRLRRLNLDGSWRLTLDALVAVAALQRDTGCAVDVADPWPLGLVVEVVILGGRHRGNWVACDILTPRDGDWCYDVRVRETTSYDGAVGFSGRVAAAVSRLHLRDVFPAY